MRGRRPVALAIATWALASIGCNDPFKPATLVQGLRVLDVIADPPELAPGETATLRAVVVAPPDDAGALTLDWALCRVRAVASTGQAVSPDCLANETAPFLEPLGQGETAQVTMPQVGFADLGLPDSTGGVYLPVRLRARAGALVVDAVYRIRYALLPPRNTNPALDTIVQVVGGGDAGPEVITPLPLDPPTPPGEAPPPLEVELGRGVTLRATARTGSAESYLRFTGDLREMKTEPVTELMRFYWYSTAGRFSNAITGEARPDTELTFKEDAPAPGALMDLWVVLRDERGGSDVAHRTLRVR